MVLHSSGIIIICFGDANIEAYENHANIADILNTYIKRILKHSSNRK